MKLLFVHIISTRLIGHISYAESAVAESVGGKNSYSYINERAYSTPSRVNCIHATPGVGCPAPPGSRFISISPRLLSSVEISGISFPLKPTVSQSLSSSGLKIGDLGILRAQKIILMNLFSCSDKPFKIQQLLTVVLPGS